MYPQTANLNSQLCRPIRSPCWSWFSPNESRRCRNKKGELASRGRRWWSWKISKVTAIRNINVSKTSYQKISDLACVKLRKRYGWMLVVWGPSLFNRKSDSLIPCFCFMSKTLSRSWDCLWIGPKERVQVQYPMERDSPFMWCLEIWIWLRFIRFYVTIQCEPIRLCVLYDAAHLSLHANVGWNQQRFPVSSRVASVLVVGQAGHA